MLEMLYLYGAALAGHWLAVMTGSLPLVIDQFILRAVFEKWRKWQDEGNITRRRFEVGILLVAIIWAGFSAWKDEYQKANALEITVNGTNGYLVKIATLQAKLDADERRLAWPQVATKTMSKTKEAPSQIGAVPFTRQLIISRHALQTTMSGKNVNIDAFRLSVHNIGTEPLKFRVDLLKLSANGVTTVIAGLPSNYAPATPTLYMETPIKFATPIFVTRPAKDVIVELQITYDNDPAVGTRTMCEKIQYPIFWSDTQAALLNSENVLEHLESKCVE
jgi:hypothetical protein